MPEYTPPIYRRFPKLEKNLPRLRLTDLPTPVEPMAAYGRARGLPRLWVKRDDCCSAEYGGNKPRKLEFDLARALDRGAERILTMGGIGSNFCLASAMLARKHGLDSTLVLFPQQVTPHVRQCLELYRRFGADLELAPHMRTLPAAVAYSMLKYAEPARGRFPYFIPMGGSSALGTIGYVNAALELAEQVRIGELPEPDYVFCAVGSGGTLVGLDIGFALSGLGTKVAGISVTMPLVINRLTMSLLANACLRELRRLGADIPAGMRYLPGRIQLTHRYWGGEYGRPTPEGERAVAVAEALEEMRLDSTYTGKCLAGLEAEARRRGITDKNILFLNSFNSADLEPLLDPGFDHRALPQKFHRFFTP